MNAILAAHMPHTDPGYRALAEPRRANSAVPRSASALVRLAERSTVRIQDGEGTRIAVISGVLWITEENRFDDVVLQPGDPYRVRNAGKTLLYAERRANLRIEVPARRRPRSVEVVAPGSGDGRPILFRHEGPSFVDSIMRVLRRVRAAWDRLWSASEPIVARGGWIDHDTVYSSRRPRGDAWISRHRRVDLARDALTRRFRCVHC